MLHTKAAEGGDCGIIKTLCDYGADPHGEPGYLLDTLVEGNHADAIRLCAQYGISQEYRQERVNLLQVAAMNGYIRSVSALLDAGFDLEHEGRARRTPLLDAVQGGHIETTRYLLDAGANIRVQDREGHNALDLAVRCDEPHEMLELLIGRGAEINRQPGNGGTPVLHWAACMGLISYINKFCAAGVPVNLRDAYGQTALHHAARTGKTETIRALLQGGADPSAMDDEHKTPVHEAAWRRDPTGIRLLLHANAACNTPDVRGYVPLHVAAQHGSIETCRLILERLDDSEYLGSTKGGQMALHLATKGGHLEVVQLLLDAGISQKDALLCHPALHEAAAGRHLDILKLLTLDNTADPYYIDAYGRTAFDWASTDPAALAIMKSRYGKYTPTESKMRRARLIETVVELGTSFIKQLEVARWQLNPRVLIRALLYLDEKSQQPSSTDEKP
ncbi:ankyrin repeat-containing domain protein [Aspergillus filifer]